VAHRQGSFTHLCKLGTTFATHVWNCPLQQYSGWSCYIYVGQGRTGMHGLSD
jgi:hypothetical protein